MREDPSAPLAHLVCTDEQSSSPGVEAEGRGRLRQQLLEPVAHLQAHLVLYTPHPQLKVSGEAQNLQRRRFASVFTSEGVLGPEMAEDLLVASPLHIWCGGPRGLWSWCAP